MSSTRLLGSASIRLSHSRSLLHSHLNCADLLSSWSAQRHSQSRRRPSAGSSCSYVRAAILSFDSKVFQPELVQFPGSEENIYVGGRDKFSHLPKAFEGIKQVGFIGWGSQAPAQAQNLRDSLQAVGSDIKVAIGLRENSSSREEARQCGFKEQDGTLDEIYNVITASDFVILLISDGAQVQHQPRLSARHFQTSKLSCCPA